MNTATVIPITTWPAPQSLTNDLSPIPAFGAHFIPECLRTFVLDSADRMKCPPELIAAPTLIALAACVGRRVRIQPKSNDTGWREVPNLYGCVVAPPGLMKTPAANQVFALLDVIEDQWEEENQRALAEWKESKANKEDEGNKGKGKGSKASKANKQDPGPKPPEKRLIINNATWEAAHKVLSENPQGCLIQRDELSGLLAETEKCGHEGERQFLLECANGNSTYRTDRIGRERLKAPLCLSVFGGIQPKLLRAFMSGASKGGVPLSNDGFAQRLQILVWPDQPVYAWVNRTPDEEATKTMRRIFRVLSSLPADPPLIFTFDDEAHEYHRKWHTDLQNRVRSKPSPELPELLNSHLTKYTGLMPKLAVLFELAERAAAPKGKQILSGKPTPPTLPDPDNRGLKVSLAHTIRAANLCEYLEQHARRFYDIATAEQYAAQTLGLRLQTDQELKTFTESEIKEKSWRGLKGGRVAEAISALVKKHWIVSETKPTIEKVGGRPTTQYRVNPRIYELAEHRENGDG